MHVPSWMFDHPRCVLMRRTETPQVVLDALIEVRHILDDVTRAVREDSPPNREGQPDAKPRAPSTTTGTTQPLSSTPPASLLEQPATRGAARSRRAARPTPPRESVAERRPAKR